MRQTSFFFRSVLTAALLFAVPFSHAGRDEVPTSIAPVVKPPEFHPAVGWYGPARPRSYTGTVGAPGGGPASVQGPQTPPCPSVPVCAHLAPQGYSCPTQTCEQDSLCANVAPPGHPADLVIPMQSTDSDAPCHECPPDDPGCGDPVCDAVEASDQQCRHSEVIRSCIRSQIVVDGACAWGEPECEPAVCPVQCPLSQDTEERDCPDGTSVQTRSRSLTGESGSCVWGPWSDWVPADCPAPCSGYETEPQLCPDGETVQTRVRSQFETGGSCVWGPWSDWVPLCPVRCAAPQSETRSCESDPSVTQTRTRSTSLVNGACAWGSWSPWSPACPVTCAPDQTEQNTCSDGSTVQTRTRSQVLAGGVCQWQDWSPWSPADCPVSPCPSLPPPDPSAHCQPACVSWMTHPPGPGLSPHSRTRTCYGSLPAGALDEYRKIRYSANRRAEFQCSSSGDWLLRSPPHYLPHCE